MSTVRVLITGDEGTGTLAAVRGLRAGGFEPWLAVTHPRSYAARSNTVEVVLRVADAKEEPDAHARQVAEAALAHGLQVVLPGTEGSLRALTGREDLFDREVAIGTNPLEALDHATDKLALAADAAASGLETPPVEVVRDGALPDRVELPAIVKPVATVAATANGYATRHAHRVTSRDELAAAVAGGGTWLLQPYVEGRLGAICGVVWRGRLVCASHQTSPRIWPPARGISSYAVTVPRDAALEEGVAALLARVGWSGVFGVQYIERNGRKYVIDLNPRIYGSTALAVAAGHNLPTIWTELLLGREPAVGPYRVGVRYRVEEDDLRAIVATRDWGGLVPRRHTVWSVFSWRDPKPSLESLRKLVPG